MKQLILLVLFLIGAFYTAKEQGLIGNPCDPKAVQKEVEKIYQSLPNTEPGRGMLVKMNDLVSKGTINESDKERLIRANLRLAVLTEGKCEIPSELKAELTNSYMSNPSGKVCPEGMYKPQAESEISRLQGSSEYLAIEQQAYQQISAQISSSEGKAKLAKKWQDDNFRKRIMIAVLQIGLRDQNGCANVALPIAEMLPEFMN